MESADVEETQGLVVSNFENNTIARDRFVHDELLRIPTGSKILDVGAGNQPHRRAAAHLEYVAQDFEGFSDSSGYSYGPTDVVSNAREMPLEDGSFDAVLCTEVIEHVPYAVDTIREISRVLRSGGTLILSAPSNYRRHFDPHYYSAGFSDRWYETILPQHGFEIVKISPEGDFFKWMKIEIYRLLMHQKASALFLLPALIFFHFKRATPWSVEQMCNGYHVTAVKVAAGL